MADQSFSSKHGYYSARARQWIYNSDHYDGPAPLLASSNRSAEYLSRFKLENEADFYRRLKRSAGLYENLLKRSLHVYQSQLWRVAPERKLAGVLEEEGLDDIDGFGTDADVFFANVTNMAQLFGVSYVLVDGPQIPTEEGAAPSSASMQSSGLRPWVEHIAPLKVIDWDVESFDPLRRGQLNYVVICDQVTVGKEIFQTGDIVTRYRVYTPGTFQVFHQRASNTDKGSTETILFDEGFHGFGRVPLVPFYDEFIEPMQGGTLMDGVAYAANSIWNTSSVLDESFYNHGFNILAMFSDKEISEVKLGETKGLNLDREDDVRYIAPSTAPWDFGRSRIRDTIERVADLVFARTSRQLPSGQVESAEKRNIDRAEFTAMLERKASGFEESEEQVWDLLATAWGQPGEQEINYNRNFKVGLHEAEEWVTRTLHGVASLAEWYMAEHPEVTSEEEAWLKVRENLANNRSTSTLNAERELMDLGTEDRSVPEEAGSNGDATGDGSSGTGEAEGTGTPAEEPSSGALN